MQNGGSPLGAKHEFFGHVLKIEKSRDSANADINLLNQIKLKIFLSIIQKTAFKNVNKYTCF